MKGSTFIVGRETGWEPALRMGLSWLASSAEKAGLVGLIVVPTMRQYRSGALAGLVGDAAGKALASQVPVQLGSARIQGATARTFNRWRGWSSGPVLLVWPDKALLRRVNDDHRVTDLCVVPWTYGEVRTWAEGTRATDLLGPNAEDTEDKMPAFPPLLVAALESLTNRVNLSTGLVHSMDRAAAIQMFKLLSGNVHWDPASVEAWALGNGWNARGASQLREIAQGVREGRRYRVGRPAWTPDVVSRWQRRTERS